MHKGQSGVIFGIVIAGMALTLVLTLAFGLPAYNRYQRRANASNTVKVTAIQIANTKQLVDVENQKAQIRIADAEGIAKAQQIIAGSLTPAYLQYLAIQAQTDMANGVNHTVVYVPTGKEGIPLVGTINSTDPSSTSAIGG